MQRWLDPAAHGSDVQKAGIHIVSSPPPPPPPLQHTESQAQNQFLNWFSYVCSKPQSSKVPVEDLIQSLKAGPFTVVKGGSAFAPLHQATIDR